MNLRGIAGLAVVVGLLTANALMAVPASAHVVIVGTTPAADSVLDAAPGRAEVRFDTDILDIGYAIVVRSDDGRTISTGTAHRGRDSLSIALDPTAGPGAYSVGFRVVSADGHSVTSSFHYRVRGANTSQSAAVDPGTPSNPPDITAPVTASPAGLAQSFNRWTPGLLALVAALGVAGAALLGWSLMAGSKESAEKGRGSANTTG